MIKSISWLVTAAFVNGCLASPLVLPEDGSENGLSSFSINMPERKDLEDEKLFGSDCEAIKLDEKKLKELGTDDKCEAALLLLSSYRLKVEQTQCDDGVVATKIDKIASAKSGELDASVKKGCTYSVLIGLGKYDNSNPEENVIYYSNLEKSEGILEVAADAPDELPPLSVVLLATEAAIELGFPDNKAVVTSGVANVSIDVEIGDSDKPGSSDDDSVSNGDADAPVSNGDDASSPGATATTSSSSTSSTSSTGGVPDPT